MANLLRCQFHDLDRAFETRHGDIDEFIHLHGYAAYAWSNVETYKSIKPDTPAVIALSSGFMTYPDGTHPELPTIRQSIATQPSTFVLLPSLDLEECVTETKRRQRERSLVHRRTDHREEDVIRERFPVYMALPARKVSTMRRTVDIAVEIVTLLEDPGSSKVSGRIGAF